MTDVTNTQSKSSLLSPGTIFLISVIGSLLNPIWGVVIAFTFLGSNYWRMGEKRNALSCFVFSIPSLLILNFIYPERPTIFIFPSDWSTYAYLAYFVTGEAIVLGTIYFALKQAKKPDIQIVTKSYRFELILAASIVAGYFIFSYGTNQIFKLAGYCEAPRIYDILLRNAEKGREGLETILVQRSDLGCGWRWIYDEVQTAQGSDRSDGSMKHSHGSLAGDYLGEYTTIYQDAWLFDQEISSEIIADKFKPIEDGKEFHIDIPASPGMESSKIYCTETGHGELKSCTLLVEYEHTLLRLHMMSDFSQEQFAKTIELALSGTSKRALEYESTFP